MFEFIIFGDVFFRVNTETGEAWQYEGGIWVMVEDEDEFGEFGMN